MRKIALITPMLQPYRLSFYDKLNAFHPEVEWLIFHGVKKTEDGRPAFAGETRFRNRGLSELKYRIGPFDVRIHQGLYREVVDFCPDMIIIQSITGNLSYRKVVNWARRNKKIIVNWACAWEPGFAKGAMLKLKNMLVSSFYKKGDYVLTYSTKALQYVKDRGIHESMMDVCYNGIETDDLVKHEDEILLKSEDIIIKHKLDGSIAFLYVGGLLAEKRVDLLMDAFIQVRLQNSNAKLIIIGDGPMKNELLGKINQQDGMGIEYLGRIIDGVDKYFAAATCLVLPGVGGLALNQAMFWRKICIASEADGTEEDLILHGKTGFRFIKDDLESLTEAMLKVVKLSGPELEQMGNQARDIILTKSSVNNMVEVFTKTIIRFFPELKGDV